jgi:hypothetical protein
MTHTTDYLEHRDPNEPNYIADVIEILPARIAEIRQTLDDLEATIATTDLTTYRTGTCRAFWCTTHTLMHNLSHAHDLLADPFTVR